MQRSKTVTSRTVRFNKGSYVVTVPMEIVRRRGIEDGDELIFDDPGEGEVSIIHPTGNGRE